MGAAIDDNLANGHVRPHCGKICLNGCQTVEFLLIHAEHQRMVALNKPSGLPVFPRHDDSNSDCLLRRWREGPGECDSVCWPPEFCGGIAHRLDTPTSGIVLRARGLEDLRWLRGLFAARELTKVYQFLTLRDVTWDHNVVDRPLAHDRRHKKRMVVQRGRQTPHRGKWMPARTEFLRLGMAGPLFRWQAIMTSGVTHQIRVHAAFVGLALAGDKLYGGGASPEGFPSLFALHHGEIKGPNFAVETLCPPVWWPA